MSKVYLSLFNGIFALTFLILITVQDNLAAIELRPSNGVPKLGRMQEDDLEEHFQFE